VRATTPPNTVPFPLSIRSLEEGWKILFFRSGRYRVDPAKSSEWNRGAYLAEAVSDCAGCHTPRNALGGEKTSKALGGAVIDHWIAPALTEANPSPVPWTHGTSDRRARAILMISAMLGAINLSRAVSDPNLSREILQQTRDQLISLNKPAKAH